VTVRGTVGGVVASATIIVIAWQVGQGTATARGPEALRVGSTGTTATTPGTPSGATAPASTPPSSAAAPAAPSPAKASKSGTFQGDSIQTPFGNMQVALVVSSGKVTDVKVLQSTNYAQYSVQVSSYADPILRGEVIQKQSANVQMVSGATYTSQGYLQSVQSALDKAGI
jgi:uncharacterized protein with FMN-binding domain